MSKTLIVEAELWLPALSFAVTERIVPAFCLVQLILNLPLESTVPVTIVLFK
nr:hypothetical protein [Gottfriedia acidiceleris]